MKYFSSALRFGLAAAALALLPITEATAQNFYTPPASTPRVCDIPAGTSGVVRIVAGPTGKFPITTACPNNPNNTCLKWDYQWQFRGVNPSLSLVSAGSNVTVVSAPGGNAIFPVNGTTLSTNFNTSINFGNVGGEVGILFSANSDTLEASYYTDTTAVPGTVTAGFKSGNRNGFCAIAGATKPSSSGNPDLSTPQALVTSTLGCQAVWTQSADGCVTGVQITQAQGTLGTCTVTPRADQSTKQNLLNLHAASNTASCGTEINAPGSTNVCRYNSLLRTYTCVTVQ